MSHTRTLAAALLIAALAAPIVSSQSQEFVVIVPKSNPARSVEKTVLAKIFMREALRWGDGALIQPVDLSTSAPTRATFSSAVLGQSVVAIQMYWQRQLSSGGQRPPLVKVTDADAIAFVAATPGAIGYVSAATPLPETVKVLQLLP